MLLYYNKQLRVVQAGVFANYVGWGAVMPFEVIYLHEGRGFSVGVAGLVVGVVTGLAVVAAPLSGPAIDRFGARATAAAAGSALAVGYAGLGLAHTPAQAFAAAVAAGAGNGASIPSQSALVAALAPPALRHRATAASRVAANLGAGIGAAVGGVVAARGLSGFIVLYLTNAATYLFYVAVLVAAVSREPDPPEPLAGGYRLLLRDRPLVRLAAINVAAIGVGWGVFTWVVPLFARDQIGAGARVIGLLLFANAFAVVLAQLPVARFAEGRRRARMIAVACAIFAAASVLVAGAALVALPLAVAALLVAAIAVGVGECFHTAVLMPLVADLAPEALRGRYMAALGLSWWLGLALAPVLGAPLVGAWPALAMLSAAAVSLAAGAGALALERELPPEIRRTPRP